jgi:putative glutamine amidotransferase
VIGICAVRERARWAFWHQDAHPGVYGAEGDPATESTYPDRDGFEIAMLHAAVERGMPVLAICRGMQILNVAFGGTIEQNLADDGGNPRRKVIGTFDGIEHDVTLEPGSLAARAAGEEIHTERCHHHQAIADLGEGLVATGRASDGVTEAIETTDGSWVLGVQWHPEADERTSLFSALRDAAAAALLMR